MVNNTVYVVVIERRELYEDRLPIYLGLEQNDNTFKKAIRDRFFYSIHSTKEKAEKKADQVRVKLTERFAHRDRGNRVTTDPDKDGIFIYIKGYEIDEFS